MAELLPKKEYVQIALKTNGTALDLDPDTTFDITVSKYINKLSRATVRLYLAHMPIDKAYQYSENAAFKPGEAISIEAGYLTESLEEVFSGIISKHRLSRTSDNVITIELECVHKAVKMTTVRKNAIFKSMTDNSIITKLISGASLTSTVGSTTVSHDEMVQYFCTDWDFMLMRAQACGMIVLTNADKIEIDKPKLSGSASVEVKDMEGLLSFSTSLEGETQFKSVDAETWDYATQKVIKSSSGSVSESLGGDISATTLAGKFNTENYVFQTTTNMTTDELKSVAASKLTLSKMSRLKGNVVVTGKATLNAGGLIKLTGVSKHFEGTNYIGGVEHHISQESWTTELQLGFDADWYAETVVNVNNKGAGFIMPQVGGLQIGKVIGIASDKKNQYRVEVKLSTMNSKSETLFARIASFYASSQIGAVVMPEVDDEVVIGFVDNDPRSPVILGSLYSSQNKMPITLDKKNDQKVFVTKSKMKVTFNETDKSIVIETPGKITATLSDKDKKIELKDSNNNKILMDSSGITLDSFKDIKLSAKGQITIDAMSNAKLSTKASLTLEGMKVDLKANTVLQANASASLKMQSSGILQIQGSLVKIN